MLKTIQFNENGEATFEVSSDFNIHLERDNDGAVLILQKTSGTEFAPTAAIEDSYKIFDYDFTSYVYPKTIKVVSYSKVKSATLTTSE